MDPQHAQRRVVSCPTTPCVLTSTRGLGRTRRSQPIARLFHRPFVGGYIADESVVLQWRTRSLQDTGGCRSCAAPRAEPLR